MDLIILLIVCPWHVLSLGWYVPDLVLCSGRHLVKIMDHLG